jgi:hypothetical protein
MFLLCSCREINRESSPMILLRLLPAMLGTVAKSGE